MKLKLKLTSGRRDVRGHRFSYTHFVGEIPKGMFICHHCDNTICTNPKHLFLGTNLDNIRDCINKKRHPFLKENRMKWYKRKEQKNDQIQD